jgi:signal transduction histidine kinase
MRPPLPAPCDLVQLLADTALLLKNREGAAEARVEVELPAQAQVTADAAQLQQVFMNLGLNALEAVAGRGRLTISLQPARIGVSALTSGAHGIGRSYQEVEGYEACFADDGPGVPAEALGQIFVPFFTTKASGTGLGLPVADRIVKAHGGEIVVANAPEGGARFTVRLPARWIKVQGAASAEAGPGPEPGAATPPARSLAGAAAEG